MEQDIRFPIGRVELVDYSDAVRLRCLSDIEQLPALLLSLLTQATAKLIL